MTVETKKPTVDELIAKFDRKVKPCEGDLWHYTPLGSLEYFLKGEVAFSHYKFMNDDEEIEFGINFLKRISEDEDSKLFKKVFLNNPYFTSSIMQDAFLFCLSRNGDSLYQWRSYTPSGGIAISFDKVVLFDCFRNAIINNSELLEIVDDLKCARCRYTEDVTRQVMLRLAKNYETEEAKGSSGSYKELGYFIAKTLRILLTQKNPSFELEEEERFFIHGSLRSKVEFIAGKPRIVLRNPDIAKAIKTVRLSPHGDVKRNRLLVEMMRDKYGLQFDIDQSKSSYNGI